MKKKLFIFSCLFITHACAQDLATKLQALATSLTALKNVLALSTGQPQSSSQTGGTQPVPQGGSKVPQTVQTPSEKDVEQLFIKKGFIELPLEGYLGEVRTSDQNAVLKGKLYYGVVKEGKDKDKLGFYVPEVTQSTQVQDFFVNGKLLYPADKKKSDAYQLVILFNPERDANYDKDKKKFEMYNTKLKLKEIKNEVDEFIREYEKLSNASPGTIFQNAKALFEQKLKLIVANLKSIVEATDFLFINGTNLNSFKDIVQNLKSSFFGTIATRITEIDNTSKVTTAANLKKNIATKLDFFANLEQNSEVKALLAFSDKITSHKPFVVGALENQDAKKIYEILAGPEKKSQGEVLDLAKDNILIAGIRADLEEWEKDITQYSQQIQSMISELRTLFNQKKYNDADSKRKNIMNEIEKETASDDDWK